MTNDAAHERPSGHDRASLLDRVPRFFLTYFWLPIAVSFVLQVVAWAELTERVPAGEDIRVNQFFLFSFYPLFVALAFLINRLLARAEGTIAELAETGALPGPGSDTVIAELRARAGGTGQRVAGFIGAAVAAA